MEKRKNWLGMLIMVMVFGMMVISCDVPEDEKLIGVWKGLPGSTALFNELNFKSNNTVDIWTQARGTKTFSYKLDNNKLRLTDSDGDSNTGRVKFDYSGGESKIIISGFSVSIYHHLYSINGTYIKEK